MPVSRIKYYLVEEMKSQAMYDVACLLAKCFSAIKLALTTTSTIVRKNLSIYNNGLPEHTLQRWHKKHDNTKESHHTFSSPTNFSANTHYRTYKS